MPTVDRSLVVRIMEPAAADIFKEAATDVFVEVEEIVEIEVTPSGVVLSADYVEPEELLETLIEYAVVDPTQMETEFV